MTTEEHQVAVAKEEAIAAELRKAFGAEELAFTVLLRDPTADQSTVATHADHCIDLRTRHRLAERSAAQARESLRKVQDGH